MSRTVKNVTKRFIEIQYEFASLSAILEPPFLISCLFISNSDS